MYKRNRDQLDIDPADWFHGWHAHDWNYEDDEYADFQAHLEEIEAMFTVVCDKAQLIAGEHQAWIYLDADSPLQDAVYLHTPNPHSDYPWIFDHVEWGACMPKKYDRLAAGRECGIYRDEDGPAYYIIRNIIKA